MFERTAYIEDVGFLSLLVALAEDNKARHACCIAMKDLF